MFGGDFQVIVFMRSVVVLRSSVVFGGKKTHRDLGGEPQGRHILFEISSIFLLSERIL